MTFANGLPVLQWRAWTHVASSNHSASGYGSLPRQEGDPFFVRENRGDEDEVAD